MKKPRDRRFKIDVDDIAGPFLYDGQEDTFFLRFTEYADDTKPDKVVEMIFHGCFLWQAFEVVQSVVTKKQGYIDREQANLNSAVTRFKERL